MMIQDIIAYLILFAAFGIFIQKILRFLNLSRKSKSNSSACGGCTTGCEMKEIHLMKKGKFAKRDQYRFYL